MDANQPQFRTIATARSTPNPLRPYYVPPSIGDVTSSATKPGSALPSATTPPASAGFGSKARNAFADVDYSGYVSDGMPSMGAMAKQLVDQAMWRYTSILLAQPFEVSKTILQCYHAGPTPVAAAATAERRRGRLATPEWQGKHSAVHTPGRERRPNEHEVC